MMNHSEDRLDWLAFRYVANELDEVERDEFELQLAADQDSREAVTRLVKQTAMLSNALTERTTVAAATAAWSIQPARWLIIATGSCLLLLIAVMVSRQVDDASPNLKAQTAVASNPLETADLACAWAESLSETDDGEVDESLEVLWASADDADESLAPPSWMLAAVEGIGGEVTSALEIQE